MIESQFDKLMNLPPIVETRSPRETAVPESAAAPSFGDHLHRAAEPTSRPRPEQSEGSGARPASNEQTPPSDVSSPRAADEPRHEQESGREQETSRETVESAASDEDSAPNSDVTASNQEASGEEADSDDASEEKTSLAEADPQPASDDVEAGDGEAVAENVAAASEDVVLVDNQHAGDKETKQVDAADAENHAADEDRAVDDLPRRATATQRNVRQGKESESRRNADPDNGKNPAKTEGFAQSAAADKQAQPTAGASASADASLVAEDGGPTSTAAGKQRDAVDTAEQPVSPDKRTNAAAVDPARLRQKSDAQPIDKNPGGQSPPTLPATGVADSSNPPDQRRKQKQTGNDAPGDEKIVAPNPRSMQRGGANGVALNATVPEWVDQPAAESPTSVPDTGAESPETTTKVTSEPSPATDMRTSRRFTLPVGGQSATATNEADGPTAHQRARFVQRVARAVQAVGDRGGPLRLRLSPPELGALRLEVAVQGGVLTARIEAESPTARTMLLDNLPALRDRLAGQDIKIERFDVDLMDQSPDGLPRTPQEDRNSANQQRRTAANARRRTEADVDRSGDRGERNPIGGDGELNVVV